ncbi:MAG: hypothetical protein M0P02_03020 [Sulfurospirillaceae bacterium]|jgi:hypothetical protein|nr:hypothetical protein [Sulfurospirillaceae bacterium]MCK9546115.1 hypothetical protein [Sulfurospirillaceae bacterium]MDY0238676.1 hypothetical protein [Campylobacterales bacterium]NLN00192.1 hypothetical protein [Campylobacteraceae bacterium]
MKKVTISVASKDYTITLEDAFADYFTKDLEKLLGSKKGFDIKELLTAFVQKSYENYRLESNLNSVVMNIESKLSNN